MTTVVALMEVALAEVAEVEDSARAKLVATVAAATGEAKVAELVNAVESTGKEAVGADCVVAIQEVHREVKWAVEN